MQVNHLKRFLMTCSPAMPVGITVQTKEGPQFWDLKITNASFFHAPNGSKCLSLMDVRKNDPLPQGSVVEGEFVSFDDAPINPDDILHALNERFDLDTNQTPEEVKQLTTSELVDIMLEMLHKEIGELISLNNNLLVYIDMKNKFKKQKEYWIDVKPKSEN